MTGDGNEVVRRKKKKETPVNWTYLKKEIILCLHGLFLLAKQPKGVGFLEPDAYICICLVNAFFFSMLFKGTS